VWPRTAVPVTTHSLRTGAKPLLCCRPLIRPSRYRQIYFGFIQPGEMPRSKGKKVAEERRPTNVFEGLLSERESDLLDLALHTVHSALGNICQDVMGSTLTNTQESIDRLRPR